VAGGRAEEHLAAFAAHMTQGLLACWTALGLEVMVELMELEVTERPAQGQAQPGPDRDAAASQPGTVTLGGRRLGMGRPGVCSVDQEAARELGLQSYAAFSSTDLLAELLARRLDMDVS
jgi:hypothetical protein